MTTNKEYEDALGKLFYIERWGYDSSTTTGYGAWAHKKYLCMPIAMKKVGGWFSYTIMFYGEDAEGQRYNESAYCKDFLRKAEPLAKV